MRSWRRMIGVSLMLSVGVGLTGCWDQHPVEDRAAVAAIGIDPGNQADDYRYTFTFPNVATTTTSVATIPSAQQFYTLTVFAPNLLAALTAVQRRESRTLYLGQVRIVCLSSRLPASVWTQTLNSMADSGRFVLTTWIVAAPRASAIVGLAPPVEVVPEVALYNALACRCQAIRWPGRAWRTWANLVTPGVSAAVAWVRPQADHFVLSRLLVVGPHRLTAWSPLATAGWAYLTGQVLSATLTVNVNTHPAVVALIRGHTQWHVRDRDGNLTAYADLDYSGVLVGVPGGEDSLARNAVVQAAVVKAIQQRVQRAWSTATATQSDPMGWHRDARWSDDDLPVHTTSWRHWSLVTRVRFRLREEGVLR